MAEDKRIRIHFVCEARDSGSPALPVATKIADELVRPAIPSNWNASLDVTEFRGNGEATLDHYSVDMLAEVDLVVADLGELSDTAYFLLGARAYKDLPVVFIKSVDRPLPFEIRPHFFMEYEFSDMPQAVDMLRAVMEIALEKDTDPSPIVGPPLSPRAKRLELVSRIEATAAALRSLRINSASESVEELIAISEELRISLDDSPSNIRKTLEKALKVLHALLDQAATDKGAQITIAGAIALLVGGAGYSGAAAYGATLAYWFGKDTFTKWLEGWTKKLPRK